MEEFLKVGIYVDNVKLLKVKDVSVEGQSTDALILKNVGEFIEE